MARAWREAVNGRINGRNGIGCEGNSFNCAWYNNLYRWFENISGEEKRTCTSGIVKHYSQRVT